MRNDLKGAGQPSTEDAMDEDTVEQPAGIDKAKGISGFDEEWGEIWEEALAAAFDNVHYKYGGGELSEDHFDEVYDLAFDYIDRDKVVELKKKYPEHAIGFEGGQND